MAGMTALASSISAMNKKYQTITYNLANVSTNGFKRQNINFSSKEVDNGPGLPSSSTLEHDLSIDYTQGSMVQTDRKLDVALHGPGFLMIETPKGPRYTRNGQIQVDMEGNLTTRGGELLAGIDGTISIPENASTNNIIITKDGKVFDGKNELGQLQVVEFEKPEKLTPIGGAYFEAPKNAKYETATKTHVMQGYQESSNVNIVEELVDLIKVSRIYEANMKTITAQDERMQGVLSVSKGI